MYLFSRSARLAPGRTRDAMEWSFGMAEKVNQIIELDVSLWTPMFSAGVGTMIFSAFAPDLEALETAQSKLMADEGYLAEVDRGATFSNGIGPDDTLLQLVHGDIDPTRSPQYAAVVTSQLAPGRLASGTAVGVEIAQRVEEITGIPTGFGIGATGPYGGVAWITGYESLQQLESAEQATNSDPEFVQLVDGKGAESFVSHATTQTILRRLV